MERKIVILEIAKLISGYDYYGDPSSYPTSEDLEMAERILDKLEKLGMSKVNKYGQATEGKQDI